MKRQTGDTNRIEVRSYALEDIELRSQDEPRLKGHAAVFDRWSDDLGGFKERIAKGAFTKTLQESDVRMLWDHNSQFVLGRKSAGTLQLLEDNQGLYFENLPPDTTWFRDLAVSMQRGDVSQMSFGFNILRETWNEDYTKRDILEVRLVEISIVTFPAYPQTSVAVRSLPNGVSVDHLLEIVTKRARGEEATDEEIVELHAAAEYLRSMGGEEPSRDTPPADTAPSRDTQYRNYLAELEAEITLAL